MIILQVCNLRWKVVLGLRGKINCTQRLKQFHISTELTFVLLSSYSAAPGLNLRTTKLFLTITLYHSAPWD